MRTTKQEATLRQVPEYPGWAILVENETGDTLHSVHYAGNTSGSKERAARSIAADKAVEWATDGGYFVDAEKWQNSSL